MCLSLSLLYGGGWVGGWCGEPLSFLTQAEQWGCPSLPSPCPSLPCTPYVQTHSEPRPPPLPLPRPFALISPHCPMLTQHVPYHMTFFPLVFALQRQRTSPQANERGSSPPVLAPLIILIIIGCMLPPCPVPQAPWQLCSLFMVSYSICCLVFCFYIFMHTRCFLNISLFWFYFWVVGLLVGWPFHVVLTSFSWHTFCTLIFIFLPLYYAWRHLYISCKSFSPDSSYSLYLIVVFVISSSGQVILVFRFACILRHLFSVWLTVFFVSLFTMSSLRFCFTFHDSIFSVILSIRQFLRSPLMNSNAIGAPNSLGFYIMFCYFPSCHFTHHSFNRLSPLTT